MCGIFGIFQYKQSVSKINLEKSMQSLLTMKHRGPNAQIIRQVDDKTLLGHLRLSIIDLGEQSNQPFVSADGLTQLVFNGEIYNYIEIRAELLKKDISSKPTVILKYCSKPI